MRVFSQQTFLGWWQSNDELLGLRRRRALRIVDKVVTGILDGQMWIEETETHVNSPWASPAGEGTRLASWSRRPMPSIMPVLNKSEIERTVLLTDLDSPDASSFLNIAMS